MGNKINAKQRLFCIEYLKDWNATQAAIRAGYAKKTAYSIGQENLKKPELKAYISDQIEDVISNAKIPLEKKILDYWLVRAFYNITDIMNLDGSLKTTEEKLRENGLWVCIDSINKKVDTKGNAIVIYKFANKDEAVQMLQRYIGMIKEDPPQVQQNNTFVDLKAVIINQAKTSPKEQERIVAELEKITGYTE